MVEKVEKQALATAMERILKRVEPQWLKEIRIQAWQRANQLELPRVDKIAYKDWPQFITSKTIIKQQKDIDAQQQIEYQLSNYADHYSKKLAKSMQEKGLKTYTFKEAIQLVPQILKDQLIKMLKQANTKTEAYQIALMTSGWLIKVPDNVEIDEVLTILTDQASDQQTDYCNQTIVILGKNSKLKIMHEIASTPQSASPTHIGVNITLHANAQLQYIGLDQLASNFGYLKRTAHLATASQLNWQLVDLSKGNLISECTSHLIGAGSESKINVISITSQQQQHGFNTKLLNYGHHSKGEINQRGVLLDASKLVFNGIGKIYHGAHGTYANQENRLMMLSSHASGDANPILLIEENDVVAGHAASVGQIDKQQLYYLMSRGLSKAMAQKLVVTGFLSKTIDSSIDQALAQRILGKIEEKLVNG